MERWVHPRRWGEFLPWAMREDREAKVPNASQECIHCRTVLSSGALLCIACGSNDLRERKQSRFPYDALAAFLGVIVVIIYWLGR
jgi:hypothetical protein